jgi:hypothetical protein
MNKAVSGFFFSRLDEWLKIVCLIGTSIVPSFISVEQVFDSADRAALVKFLFLHDILCK